MTTTDTDAPEPSERPTNVTAALARVALELPGIAKADRASPEQGGYQYRGIEAITREAQRLLGGYGVVFVPEVLSIDIKPITVGGGKPWTDTILQVRYTVYGPGGIEDKIAVGPLYALGRDNSDKGANKCMTQAFKYALLQVLCIGDSKDDADGSTHEADGPRPLPEGERLARAEGWQTLDEYQACVALVKEASLLMPAEALTTAREWREKLEGSTKSPLRLTATMEALQWLAGNLGAGVDELGAAVHVDEVLVPDAGLRIGSFRTTVATIRSLLPSPPPDGTESAAGAPSEPELPQQAPEPAPAPVESADRAPAAETREKPKRSRPAPQPPTQPEPAPPSTVTVPEDQRGLYARIMGAVTVWSISECLDALAARELPTNGQLVDLQARLTLALLAEEWEPDQPAEEPEPAVEPSQGTLG